MILPALPAVDLPSEAWRLDVATSLSCSLLALVEALDRSDDVAVQQLRVRYHDSWFWQLTQRQQIYALDLSKAQYSESLLDGEDGSFRRAFWFNHTDIHDHFYGTRRNTAAWGDA